MRLTLENAAIPCPGDLVLQFHDKDLCNTAAKVTKPIQHQHKVLLAVLVDQPLSALRSQPAARAPL